MKNIGNPLNINQTEPKSQLHYFRMNILDPRGNCVLCGKAAEASNHVMAGNFIARQS